MRRVDLGAAMRAIFILAFLICAAAGPPALAQAPICGGKDLLDELAQTDPAAWKNVKSEAKRTINGGARLWRVERAGVAPSYLFGTLHSTDPRITAISPHLEAALAATRTIAIEIADPSPTAVLDVFKASPELLLYTTGEKLEAKLEPKAHATVRARLERSGMAPEIVALIRPWFAYTMLSLPDCEQARKGTGLKVLDVVLAEEGRRRGHSIVGLETVREQLEAMASVSDAEQLRMLQVAVAWSPRADDVLESVQQRYLKGEMDAAWPLQLALAAQAGFASEQFAEFKSNVLVQRNLVMRDRSLPLLAAGRALIAVGGLHLVGEQGLVALYRAAGYAVTPIE